MNQAAEGTAQDLEAALLERARKLAEEHLAHARDISGRIHQEEDERLRLREEREVLSAKEQAERLYRRRVQAEELKLREELERRRWALIEEAMGALAARLKGLVEDDDDYLPVLQRWLAEAAAAIPHGDLAVQLNGRDRARLVPQWGRFAAEAVEGRAVALDERTHGDAGGLHLRDAADRIWVDSTFTGRMERLADELHQIVAARMFPPGAAGGPGDQ